MPLKGIKVLELAGLAPGPFCGMILADFGASVVRVDKAINSVGVVDCLMHGKRSIGLNIKSPRGAELFHKMSDSSDVIIDPYRPGVLEKLNLGPSNLLATNKKLIYARLTGFGQDGPFANMAGHDINYTALTGILSLLGRHREKPLPPINLAADFGGGGLICALGIVLALFQRTKSNLGQVVDTSMVDGLAYLGSWMYRSQKIPGIWGQPRGKNILDGGAHFYDTYETLDGKYMAVGALESQFYAVLLEKLNLTEDEVPHFENFEEGRERFSQVFNTKTQEEWCKIFDGTDACVTPVLTLDSVQHNKHNAARQTFRETANGTLIPKPAPQLSKTPGYTRGLEDPSLAYGEHSVDILLEYGFSLEVIDKYISEGVVYQQAKLSKL